MLTHLSLEIGSNEPLVQKASVQRIGELAEEDEDPVIEIWTTVTVAPQEKQSRSEASFSDVYYAAPGAHASNSERKAAAQAEDAIAEIGDNFPSQKPNTATMLIHSRHLCRALEAVRYINYNQLHAPYVQLFHMREELAAYRDNQPACHSAEYRATTAKHIDVLLNFLEGEYGEEARAEQRRYAQTPPTATSDNIWMLYKAGDVAYAPVINRTGSVRRWRAYMIKSAEFVSDSKGLAHVNVHCWHLCYVRCSLQRHATSFIFPRFKDEAEIQSLPIVPARFFQENPAQQGGLSMAAWQVQLGRAYWELTKGPAYKELVFGDDAATTAAIRTERIVIDIPGDLSLTENEPPPAQGHKWSGPANRGSPPMAPSRSPPPRIDPEIIPRYTPYCKCDACVADGSPRLPHRFAEISKFGAAGATGTPEGELLYLLCTTEVPAFMPAKRQWVQVQLESVRAVQPDREAFERLVLDDDIKATVRALAGKFAHIPGDEKEGSGRVAPWPRDLVKNKGEGRIFLLHGSPGVGKTCTAECVAELAARPLLALTSGDISTHVEADVVERNLDRYLQLGERYGALVLLDEADVFLEARRASDLHRNSLVSVFLRALEYFHGVLFLTTNRVETFDVAFTSRIHVALHYLPLSADHRRRVWAHHFDRLARDSGGRIAVLPAACAYAMDDAEVHALALNGREIRNALQTAVALAEAEAEAGMAALAQMSLNGESEADGDVDDSWAGSDKGVGSDVAVAKAALKEPAVVVTEKHLRAVIKMSSGFKAFMLHGKRDNE